MDFPAFGNESNDVLCFCFNFGSIPMQYKKVPTKIKEISKGGEFILDENGDLYNLNLSFNGMTRLYDYINYPLTTANLLSTKIINISMGTLFTLFLTEEKQLLGIGNNKYHGCLGLGQFVEEVKTPTLIMNGVIKFCAGNIHSLVQIENGDVMGFGCNECGQLGLEELSNIFYPKFCFRDREIEKIICSFNFSFLHKKNGDLYGMGQNRATGKNAFILGIKNNRKSFIFKPEFIGNFSIKSFASGYDHSLLLTKEPLSLLVHF
eukprot:TRINITY_DN10340_c0_g1_i1.p1 TRINITY_DN10340_c0_g1~~TRINITY_DN10340_c0_g1_i1.p1  ORF type:complete len:263 (-),score=43.16 TRINITY_DN10340_c0_g1_i1:77-865(-)